MRVMFCVFLSYIRSFYILGSGTCSKEGCCDEFI